MGIEDRKDHLDESDLGGQAKDATELAVNVTAVAEVVRDIQDLRLRGAIGTLIHGRTPEDLSPDEDDWTQREAKRMARIDAAIDEAIGGACVETEGQRKVREDNRGKV